MRQTFRSLFNRLRSRQEHQASASNPATDGAAPVSAANATSPGNLPAQTLQIRYDSIALPETVQNWLHASRYVAHRAQGAEYFHVLAANADPDFCERLQWAALCLYQDGLDDALNQLAMQAQLRLSDEAKDPDIRAYARFMGQMWPSLRRQQRLSEEQVRAESPTWMADDWMLLDMARAGSDEDRLLCFNQLLSSKGITTLGLQPPDHSSRLPALDRLESKATPPSSSSDADGPAPLVSIIVPVYNAEDTVETSIRSLLAQTWKNIEIIAVDDASSDGSMRVLERLAAADRRIRVLRSAVNQGAYPSRNKGLKEARGDYVTVADSDDWHHPQKIECQVRSLLSHPRLIANMSGGFRAIDNLQPVARARPFFKQSNLSSLLFPRLRVMEALGGWNAVRFGADTEFFNRLAMVFGADAICTLDLPLFVGRSRPDSLTNDPLHGYVGHDLGARKEYVACYRYFHRNASRDELRYSIEPDAPLPFPVPGPAHPGPPRVTDATILVAAHLQDKAQATWAIRQHQAALSRGVVARIVHAARFSPQWPDSAHPFLRDYLFKHQEALSSLEEGSPHAKLLQYDESPEVNDRSSSRDPFDLQALDELWRDVPQSLRIRDLDSRMKAENVSRSWWVEHVRCDALSPTGTATPAALCHTVESFGSYDAFKRPEDSEMWAKLLEKAGSSRDNAGTTSALKKELIQLLPVRTDYRLHALLANLSNDDEEWLSSLNAYLAAIGPVQLSLRAYGPDQRPLRLAASTRYPQPSIDPSAPLVSVIMPCYNAEKYLRWAAESILDQTWPNVELIVVDDCSTDGTPQILRELAATDSRVKLLRTPFNAGPYMAKNMGMAIAQGQYITGHDADDWALPQRIELQLLHHIALGQPISVGHMIRLTTNGMLSKIGTPSEFSPDGVLRKASVSALFDADFLRTRLGSWDAVRYGADSELLARAAVALGHQVAFANVLTMMCLDLDDSLTNHPDSSIGDGNLSGSRLFYKTAWQAWHARLESDCTYLPVNHGRRYFHAPDAMQSRQY